MSHLQLTFQENMTHTHIRERESLWSRVRTVTQVLNLNYLGIHSHYTSVCLVCPLCYVSSYCTKQVLFWGEWGGQWKTLQWRSALQKLTISCGNTSFISEYKTIHDKTGVDQINAARFQKKIAINLNRIKYLWSLFPLTGFLFLASFPLSISPLLYLLGNNWLFPT